MKIQNIFIVSLILFIATSSYGGELKKIEDDLVTPTLKLESLKGKIFDLSELKGKVVLVQFWATYCTSCRKEMPSMNKLKKDMEEAKVPFEILAIDMAETKAEVQKFVDDVKPEFPILLASPNGEDMQKWNVFAAPSNFLIDPKGKIRYTLYGETDWDSEEMVKTIKELAVEKTDSK
jgi:thiol-disulfide isomerase/thioredoxin